MNSNRTKSWCRALIAALAFSVFICESAYAGRSGKVVRKPGGTCRFLKSVELELPFNAIALSNEQRQEIRTALAETKTWPKVEMQAFVTAGAYIGERDLNFLQERRGRVVKAYLTELGIRNKDVYVGPETMTDLYVVQRPDGELAVQAIHIELSPICGGDCQWMCDAARRE